MGRERGGNSGCRYPATPSLPAHDLQATRAITINSPKSHVWPWVAQLGQNRGGFYTYDWLENLVGCDIHTSNVIVRSSVSAPSATRSTSLLPWH